MYILQYLLLGRWHFWSKCYHVTNVTRVTIVEEDWTTTLVIHHPYFKLVFVHTIVSFIVSFTPSPHYKKLCHRFHQCSVALVKLRFHENPSFKKITKNRCSCAWINGYSSFGAWNFTGCLEFYLELCKKVHAPAKTAKTKFWLKKTP